MAESKGESQNQHFTDPNSPNDSNPKDNANDKTEPAKASNAFDKDFIDRFDQREAPSQTFAALGSGPWKVRSADETKLHLPPSQRPDWGCYAEGEEQPVATAADRWLVLLLAAALPAASRSWRFKIDPGSRDPVVLLDQGTPVAKLRWADEELVATLNALSALVAAPTSLAHLLEATGAPVLERTGSILAERIQASDDTT